jgi:RNA polymerase sigma factor (sigma-70 family)
MSPTLDNTNEQSDPIVDPAEVDLDAEYSIAKTEYSSPLLSRVASSRLTVELLEVNIPILREGEAAEKALGKASNDALSPEKLRKLRLLVKKGARAKETLFNAALPLIRNISQKEYRRRSQWGSAIPLDDLMQDAIVGFFKGLRIFNLEASKNSATNYLGQWTLSEMRRSAESMDNDLQIGHDAGERFRKIRAITSRLYNDLNREASDQEIVDASNNPHYSLRPGLVGRVAASKTKTPKGVTLEQVIEEREMRNRTGSAIRIGAGTDEEDTSGSDELSVERINIADTGEGADSLTALSDPALIIESEMANSAISGLVVRLLISLELPEQQAEIIARKFGLPPYEIEASAREISRIMGIHREKIARVLNAFQSEILTPGGSLHRIIKDIDYEDLVNLELEWLYNALGEWDKSYSTRAIEISDELTRPISLSSDRKLKTMAAFYDCDFEGTTFRINLAKGSTPLNIIDCPSCSKPSNLVRFTEKVD